MLNAPLLRAAVDAFKIPDLRRKLLFTVGMLVASRFIAHVPVPGLADSPIQPRSTGVSLNASQHGPPHDLRGSPRCLLSQIRAAFPSRGRPFLTGAGRPAPTRPRSGNSKYVSMTAEPLQ